MKKGTAFIFIVCIIALYSCKKDEPQILLPKVDFSIDYNLIGANVFVKMTNNSDTSSVLWYEWDFGDGKTYKMYTSDVPQHVYLDPGKYDIKLTVTRDDYAQNSISQEVTVGETFINQVELLNMDPYKEGLSGSWWDNENIGDNVYPDLVLKLTEDDKNIFESDMISNVSNQELPVVWQIPNFKLTKSYKQAFRKWTGQQIYLYDEDENSDELMFSPEIYSIWGSMFFEYDYELQSGKFQIFAGGFILSINYIVQ